MSFAQLTAGQRAELRSALGERVALANPLDYHTYVWGDPDAMAAAFTAMVRGPADLHLLFADLPRADRCTDEDWTLAIAAFARACAEAGARGALVAAMAANLTGGRAAAWVRRGLAVLAPPDVAMAAIDAAARVGQAWAGPAAPPVAGPDGRGGGRCRGRTTAARTRSGPSGCSATTGCRCPTARSARAPTPRSSRRPGSRARSR